MTRTLAAALALASGAGAAMAEGTPPEYFTGVYERVGRDGATPPGLLNDLVRMNPVPGGLAVTPCAEGAEPLFVLGFETFGDIQNLLVARQSMTVVDLWCLYGNNGANYPLLTCASGISGGTKFMLWPKPEATCGN
ncbi:hypothetical protein LHP98_04775 [Rhodobacter sp. Har01]|uniref:hypothetical protein n=1 Tax=Rhodobacter sp. Har01 TaxID=2883999 RepID=UPI001D0663AA|nr:hypothetical protein [Rhodobacter sp. Har01]MCB6177443.1 hypothetical protein [Rhodobacter sp. Har01]